MKYEAIEGTPFHVTGSDEQGYILTVGKYRVTEPTTTIEEAIAKLDNDTWLIVSRLIAAYIHFDKHDSKANLTEEITNN